MGLERAKLGPLWIGIDQSYSGFGMTLLEENSWDQKLLKFPNAGSEAGRLHSIYHTLLMCFSLYESDHHEVSMAMEGYSHGSKFNREKLGELGGIVKLAWYTVFGDDPLVVPPTVLKKYVTGKGTASKKEMIDGVKSRWQVDIGNDNLADSYAMARYLKENS